MNAVNKRPKSDSDKFISLSEWEGLHNITEEKKHMELFEKMDRDRDRRISFFEYSDHAYMHSNIYQAFIGLDKDGSDNKTMGSTFEIAHMNTNNR